MTTSAMIAGVRSVSQRRIDEFFVRVGQDLPPRPCIPSEDVRRLRAKFFVEEPFETIDALGFTPRLVGTDIDLRPDLIDLIPHGRGCNIVEVVDGCCDTNVISTGTLSAFGVGDAWPQEAIDRANLAKFGPGGHRREDGKWIKPPDWKAPDLLKLLIRMGFDPDRPLREQIEL